MKILKTEIEIKRDERNEIVVSKFVALREEYPETTLNRIFNALLRDSEIKSKYPSLSAQTIRSICKNAGVC